MKQNLVPLAVLAGLAALPSLSQAQHYPVGAEGLKAASLPPPGFYLRDYNFGYYAPKLEGGPSNFQADGYVNAPRLIWMTDLKLLGADYGMDIIVPFGYKHVRAGDFDKSSFGLGDIEIEPLLLSWHLDQFDFSAGYALWLPTGEYAATRPDHLGVGCWGNMFTAGATFYFDKEKTWSLSALNRYEINIEQDDNFLPGNYYTLEWGLGKTFNKVWDVGVVGYYQTKTTSGDGGPYDNVVGIGPEVSAACPKHGLIASLRYLREVSASARPEGNTFVLTITKRF